MWFSLYCAFVALVQPFVPIPCVPHACELLYQSFATQSTLSPATAPTWSPYYYFDAATVHFLKLPTVLLLDATPEPLLLDAKPHWPKHEHLDLRLRRLVEADRKAVDRVSKAVAGVMVDLVRSLVV